jgi:hypothetical protein
MHLGLPVPCCSSGSGRGSQTPNQGPEEAANTGHNIGPFAAGIWGHIRNLGGYWKENHKNMS